MTIQRQYSSPNCMLLLEGFSDEQGSSVDGLPVMSVLVNAQCQILGCESKLAGGKSFFEHLVKVVSAYAQGFLSGIHHPGKMEADSDLIYLQKLPDKNRHLLIWQESKDNEDTKVEIELTTVQLFDLVETVDQFLADKLTLPELSWELQPVSRRYLQVEENLVQQSTPAVLGIASLTLAAIALFFMPTPSEVKDPNREEQVPQENTTETLPTNQFPLQQPEPTIPLPSEETPPTENTPETPPATQLPLQESEPTTPLPTSENLPGENSSEIPPSNQSPLQQANPPIPVPRENSE